MKRDQKRSRVVRGERPVVVDETTDEERPATDAELLQMGFRVMGRYRGVEHYDATPCTDRELAKVGFTTIVKDRVVGGRRTDRWERLPKPAREKLQKGGWQ